MLDLSCLQVEGALAAVGCETQGVEHATGVLSSLDVTLGVAVNLGTTDQDGFDDGQLTAFPTNTTRMSQGSLHTRTKCNAWKASSTNVDEKTHILIKTKIVTLDEVTVPPLPQYHTVNRDWWVQRKSEQSKQRG